MPNHRIVGQGPTGNRFCVVPRMGEVDRYCVFHFIRHHYHDLCDLLVAHQIGAARSVPLVLAISASAMTNAKSAIE